MTDEAPSTALTPIVARPGMVLSDDIGDYPGGIIIPVDKPWRWTSADVIRKLKWAACRHFHHKGLKVGHAGTLDPLATGVLLVCIGKATKLADTLQAEVKEYLAGVMFGATTPSYDREKEIDCRYPVASVSEEALRELLPTMTGEQEQVAPLFSAKSVDGVRAYEMARRQYKAAIEGGVFDHGAAGLLTRQHICIYSMDLVSFDPTGGSAGAQDSTGTGSGHVTGAGEQSEDDAALRPNPRINVINTAGLALPLATVSVRCSKGTYIRSLARDLGEALGSGAFLDSLRRTRTGGFSVSDALSLPQALELLR